MQSLNQVQGPLSTREGTVAAVVDRAVSGAEVGEKLPEGDGHTVFRQRTIITQ